MRGGRWGIPFGSDPNTNVGLSPARQEILDQVGLTVRCVTRETSCTMSIAADCDTSILPFPTPSGTGKGGGFQYEFPINVDDFSEPEPGGGVFPLVGQVKAEFQLALVDLALVGAVSLSAIQVEGVARIMMEWSDT